MLYFNIFSNILLRIYILIIWLQSHANCVLLIYNAEDWKPADNNLFYISFLSETPPDILFTVLFTIITLNIWMFEYFL